MKNTGGGALRDLIGEVRQMSAGGEDQLVGWVKKSKRIESVVKIPGDASTRRYYRVSSGGRTYILMKMEAFVDQADRLPFLVVQKHLAANGVDVPNILDTEPAQGTILLEDLGDVTLLRRLQEVSSPEVERHLYERVIDSLVHLQFKASRKPAEGLVMDAFRLRFDHEKLMWEMNHTIEHFYQLYLKRKISSEDMETLRAGFSGICHELAAEPTVLTHRDFHSRNIMVVGEDERLVMIDFQDARLGPAQYDLVSLLKDSYYQLDEPQIFRLIDYYVARWEALSGHRLDRHRFMHVFDMMTVQRNFKAIGSFASFLNRRGDATYLKYIGNTFENIRRTLLRHPKLSKLREVLFHYYYF